MNQGTLSILVAHRFGVLNKITGLFCRRGFNILAISAGTIQDPDIYRITIQTEGDAAQLEQIRRQICKLEDVKCAQILPEDGMVERELALIKVRPEHGDLGDLMQTVTEFAAKTVSARGGCAIIEASGSTRRIDKLIEAMKRFHIVEMSRTGMTALERNENALYPIGE